MTEVDTPSATPARASDRPSSGRDVSARELVLAVAALLVAGQLGFRAWALYPSWFYTDDYRLMGDARAHDLSWSYLTAPFDSQFMPLGRLVVWMVTHTGYTNWLLAASLTLVFQLAASCACVWMLTTLFGRRWGILAPLGIYLTTALTMPATMWWAAALNQVPLQCAFFISIAAAVHYLRCRRPRWLLLTVAGVCLGLLCYVKAILLVPVLAFLAIAYFAVGSWRERLAYLLSHFRWAVVALGVLGFAYGAFYRFAVPQPFTAGRDSAGLALDTAETMLGATLPTAIVGGPWRWWRTTPPIVLSSPPDWAVHAAWVAIVLVVLYCCLQRRNAWPAWALLLGYAVTLYALLATSRGQLFGAFAGLELRYATDLAGILTLALGLAFLPLLGAPSASRRRVLPLLRWDAGRRVIVMVTVVACGGGLLSSVRYAEFWHHDNAGAAYVRNLQADLAALPEPADLPSQTVPDDVMPEYTKPANASDVFVPIVSSHVRFPGVTDRLMVIDTDGHVGPAAIDGSLTKPTHPVPGCGWKVTGRATIRLPSPAFDWVWWIRIGYLSSQDSPLRVTAGATTVEAEVTKGLSSLFVRVPTSFGSVTLDGLAPGTTICVDKIEVGNPVPSVTP